MMKPLATIWILIYNNAKELEETVASVCRQDYDAIEVILSDDCSREYDAELMERYAGKLRKRFADVRINHNEENLGTVAHINKVIGLSKGKYFISCCSGDRFCSTDTVSGIVSRMEAGREKVLACRRADVYPDGKKKIRPPFWLGAALKFAPGWLLNYMIRRRNLLSGCCTFCSRAVFEEYGLHNTEYRLVEDYTYFVKLLQLGVRIGYTPQVVVEHGIGGVSTGKIHPLVLKDIERFREKLLESPVGLDRKTIRFLEQDIEERRKNGDH
ncbi:MAG: glycosyltransferase [Lachnospiraceae bacterium]|nr:glycosyltransferase [Lachnospiraceae bacterium]